MSADRSRTKIRTGRSVVSSDGWTISATGRRVLNLTVSLDQLAALLIALAPDDDDAAKVVRAISKLCQRELDEMP